MNSWERDQRDREMASYGVVTGSAVNRQELDYRDAQQAFTKSIDNALMQARGSASSTNAPSPTVYTSTRDGVARGPEISSTAIILVLVALTAPVAYLTADGLVAAALITSTIAAALFGLRAVIRTSVFQKVFFALANAVFVGFVLSILALQVIFLLCVAGTIVYMVWVSSGLQPALWTAGVFAAVAAAMVAWPWAKTRYRRYTLTAKGEQLDRNIRRAVLIFKIGIVGAVLWWLADTFQLIR